MYTTCYAVCVSYPIQLHTRETWLKEGRVVKVYRLTVSCPLGIPKAEATPTTQALVLHCLRYGHNFFLAFFPGSQTQEPWNEARLISYCKQQEAGLGMRLDHCMSECTCVFYLHCRKERNCTRLSRPDQRGYQLLLQIFCVTFCVQSFLTPFCHIL